jgi:predicted enzyme related to lactoylglutathione lyase
MAEASTGNFIWYDLWTSDPNEAVDFYSHVLGWTAQPWEQGYTVLSSNQGPLGGTASLPEGARKMGMPPHWAANVLVSDVDKAVAQAREMGGRVVVPAADFPKVGRLAVIADAQGASIHLFAPNEPMKIHDVSKPGEFVWHELMTSDHEAAFAFYSDLFGWSKVRDFDMGPMGKYLIYGIGDKELGGMFTTSKASPTPPRWFYYVRMPDLDAALGRAKAKGARVLNGPMEVPGGARIVMLADPQGAAFALHEAAKP